MTSVHHTGHSGTGSTGLLWRDCDWDRSLAHLGKRSCGYSRPSLCWCGWTDQMSSVMCQSCSVHPYNTLLPHDYSLLLKVVRYSEHLQPHNQNFLISFTINVIYRFWWISVVMLRITSGPNSSSWQWHKFISHLVLLAIHKNWNIWTIWGLCPRYLRKPLAISLNQYCFIV